MLFHKPAVHGVYVLCYLSRQREGTVVSAARVSEAMDVPPEQAAKVLQTLHAGGLVAATRGRSGGYRLARGLEQISLLDVIDLLTPGDSDDRLQQRDCPMGEQACTAYTGLVDAHERVRALLAGMSLAALMGHPCSKTIVPLVTLSA